MLVLWHHNYMINNFPLIVLLSQNIYLITELPVASLIMISFYYRYLNLIDLCQLFIFIQC